jgi:hypothetical protein
MNLRVRLTLTSLETRETPSSVPGTLDPSGAPTDPTPTAPAQTAPAHPSNPTVDPHG